MQERLFETEVLPMVRRLGTALILLLLGTVAGVAEVPKPADVFGFEPGADYKIADYGQVLEYFRLLDKGSDRVQLKEIGQSVEGRPLLLVYISSKDNIARLDHFRSISEKLARARVDEDSARELAAEGRAIIWVDGGLHATERAPGQTMPLLAYNVATEESPEMKKIRENVILLLMPMMNPDGLDLVADWYRKNLGTPFETTSPPRLYHHYVGHDNNRDWFMNNMPETEAVTEQLYNRWYPQIVLNHHQTSPPWARIYLPPFSDPVNPRIHPGVTTGVNIVGSAMANRFAMEKKPGVISGIVFSMWWNGGMRTVPYYHNQVGILTETGHATPTPRYYDPEKLPENLIPYGGRIRGGMISTKGTNINYPYPWRGGESHFRDAVDYIHTASMAVLDIGSNLREEWLFNMYQMGRDAIEEGKSGMFAYVIPMEQWDRGEAFNLVGVLRRGGIEVERATADFTAGGTSYAKGSFVIRCDQAFRPYLVDLMETQDYPDRRQTPDGPPDPPYDLAGWTLPLQMGVRVERIEESFEFHTEEVAGLVVGDPGAITGDAGYGFVLSHQPNYAAWAANRLLGEGERLYWAKNGFRAAGREYEAGTILIESKGNDTANRVKSMTELGLDFTGISSQPSTELVALSQARVGLYKSWMSNMDEGWTRWLLERYDFALETLHDEDVRSGDMTRFDAILLPDQSPDDILNGHPPGTMPEEYVGGLGLEGALVLKQFVEKGGTLVALDRASDFVIDQFGLPVRNVVSGVSPREFFIPGSLIRMHVDLSHPLAYGMQAEVAASFQRSRAFEIVTLSRMGEGGKEETKAPPAPPVDVVASYAENDILMSGWALGEETYIAGKAAVVKVDVGSGEVVLFAFRPQFRGQPRGTYKLLFNALQGAAAGK
jgi:hypothetical protein